MAEKQIFCVKSLKLIGKVLKSIKILKKLIEIFC
uniref:Uncharacterized protein n=1 Tax=Siphoviridae sp. ctKwY15 TaxID=2827843 RepID=A0A8S5SU02_9CAUD|nr:MAG TPA: hypothetical protein [Siphoviridae sp. ctKwY15]